MGHGREREGRQCSALPTSMSSHFMSQSLFLQILCYKIHNLTDLGLHFTICHECFSLLVAMQGSGFITNDRLAVDGVDR